MIFRSKLWDGRKHYLDKMSLRDLVRAYVAYPAIRAYALLAVLAGGIAVYAAPSPWPVLIAVVAAGLIYAPVWYLLHRFVLHGQFLYRSPRTAALWKRVHFDHHQDPNDLGVLFGALHTTLPTIVLVTVPLGWLIGGLSGSMAALASALVITCFYEFCHCIQHLAYTPKFAFLRRIKKLHLAHHFHNETGNFGITNFACDRLLGTYYPHPREVPRSATVFDLGYNGGEVERFPWVARISAPAAKQAGGDQAPIAATMAVAGHGAGAGLRVERVDGRADMARFLRLPWSIYAGDPHWVPPLLAERRGHLNRRTNPFFQHADVGFWLASRDGRPVGRISAQVNHLHLARYDDATGHFGLLEADDDPDTFQALIDAATGFLRDHGMQRVVGPFSLSINDESGLLIDGADTPPSMLMGHAPAYYAQRLSALGFVKAKDLTAYAYDLTAPLPVAAERFVERLTDDPSVRFRGLRKAHYAEDLGIVIDIFNDAWSENWGYVPFTEAEIAHFAKALKPLVRAESLCLAEVDGEPVAMAICLPNLNEAIADLDGRLLPFGWAKLLWRLKVGPMRSARVPLFGVRRRYHGSPMGAALAYGVIDRLRREHAGLGFRKAELSWILEDNMAIRRMIEAVGGRAYKTYRLYEKALV